MEAYDLLQKDLYSMMRNANYTLLLYISTTISSIKVTGGRMIVIIINNLN